MCKLWLSFIISALLVIYSSSKSCDENRKWAKCAGRDYSGETCCPAEFTCQYDNEWYSQCKPKPGTVGPNEIHPNPDGKLGWCIEKSGMDIDGGCCLPEVHNATQDQCCDACGKEPTCKAYVWNSWRNGTCFLKTATTPLIEREGCMTGIMQ